jgi:hypothetical protein
MNDSDRPTGNVGGDDNENRIDKTIHDFTERVSELFREGNQRRFEVRNPQGQKLFGLPLVFAVLIGLFLLWRVPVLLIVAVVVALVLKFQFVITGESKSEMGEPNGE